ncbi:class I tRNA ligase family protein [Candidatus Uhrbacteria bacterium]|nr:class I tRNA ligase family protein [Candidatus Uhrbacteria bacterium]
MNKSIFPKKEEEMLEYWEKEKIFEQTLAKEAPKGNFVFFEGPPTANGRPGIHHVEARAFKDLIPRYKTMAGYRVERKAGWDTHGLPVELQVEKELGISGKPQIEELKDSPEESIAYFNQKCKESVWKYLDEWVRLTKRVGFWVDLDHPYITYETPYIESLWWIIKEVWKKKLLFQDFKIVPYCARCGTALSSHEVAQGYKETSDPSIYIRFKIKGKDKLPAFFLVWTTTPWTLPANVALAVGEDIDYVKVKTEKEIMILAKSRLEVLEGEYDIMEIKKGRELAGMEYEPLYSFVKPIEKAHRVIAADFVSTEDGTGMVHIAPAFGEDDLIAAKANKLPIIITVDEEGKFIKEVSPWAGKFVKTADPEIINELQNRGLLYKSGEIKHEYPFCWRCNTPLLYFARLSWFIKMSELQDKLIKANSEINWVPEYIKEGRFGEWLRGVKDWAFSRERYWGTPLPIWTCSCGNKKVIGGLEEFPETASGNTYYFLRHGQADTNVADIASSNIHGDFHLTEQGRAEAGAAAKKLKKEKIDLIIASDFPRAKETAEIVSRELNIHINYDHRLREMEFGEDDGLPVAEFKSKFPLGEFERWSRAPQGGETLADVLRRHMGLIHELEEKYGDKKILLVGHGDPFWVLEGALRGYGDREIVQRFYAGDYIKTGEVRSLKLKTLPRNADGLADLHRPYIDSIVLDCEKCGKVMTRVAEVADVWFDSGAMPFAQWHYPFENKNKIDKGESFPADYIAEAIDQTRGWFYTLLAVATALETGKPYKNVVSLGHVLDAAGQKMSKSKGNVVDPWEVINKYGADAVRWYMYSLNHPGESKRFDENILDEMVKKTFIILWNVHIFGKTYLPKNGSRQAKSAHALDKWIVSKLHRLIKNVTADLDNYRPTEACRAISDFITDLSTWYVRRSRERFKSGDESAAATLRTVLISVSKIMAPFVPFLSESLFLELKTERDKASVHLEDWPNYEARLIDDTLLEEMETIRRLASMALEERAAAKIPVRQILSKLEIKTKKKPDTELLEILKNEINVKEIIFTETDGLGIALDTVISPELRQEGMVREISRHINDLRKAAGLTPKDQIALAYETDGPAILAVFENFSDKLKADTKAAQIILGKIQTEHFKEMELDEEALWLGVLKK